MHNSTKSYIQAVAALAGTTIGAGIFGVPYVMSQSGIIPTVLWIIGIGFILIITNLLHGEFSLRTRDDKKFVGIAKKYLSDFWGKFTGILTIISFYGSLLAYIIIGGTFLNTIFHGYVGNNISLWTFIYFIVTSLILIKGIQFLEKIELPLALILFGTLILLIIITQTKLDLSHFVMLNPKNILLPYGVVLFSLGSISAIPAIEEILDKNKKRLKQAIITAGVISIAVVLLFSLSIVGVTGVQTSQDAITGLSGHFGNSIIILGAIIGFFAIITSHLVIGHHLREIYQFDYNLNKWLSWGLAVTVPYFIYILANVSFIAVLGFVGGVIGGITGTLVGCITLQTRKFKTRKPEYTMPHNRFWAWLVIVIFSLGIIYQLYYSFFS